MRGRTQRAASLSPWEGGKEPLCLDLLDLETAQIQINEWEREPGSPSPLTASSLQHLLGDAWSAE